jgi:hypothetical protein
MRKMKKRLKRIEARVFELSEKGSKGAEKKTEMPTHAGRGAFRCSIGRSLLMLCILWVLSKAAMLEMGSAGEDRIGSWRKMGEKGMGMWAE